MTLYEKARELYDQYLTEALREYLYPNRVGKATHSTIPIIDSWGGHMTPPLPTNNSQNPNQTSILVSLV